MYLVLTAMLALNVSTDILNGFTLVDNSLHSSIAASDTRNAKLYNDFKAANADNPEKTQEWFDKAVEVQKRADSLFYYIQDFKEHIAILADGQKAVDKLKAEGKDPTMHIEGNSNLDVTAQYAIVQGHGVELKEMVAYYRDFGADLAENDAELRNSIVQTLATERGYNAHEKDSCDWEVAVFEGMPVGATITILTKMQNDVRATESQLIQYLMDRTDAGDVRVNKLNAYVIPESNMVIRGGKYRARIILAAIDSTKTPEYFVEGQHLSSDGLYEAVASSTGVKKYTGWISYLDPASGESKNLHFSSEYTVSEPAVTISNTELNIMYSNHDNKFSISVPGITNDKLRVSVAGASVRQQAGYWVIVPPEKAKEITISVSAELDGKMQSMGSQKYRVKPLPTPAAYFAVGGKEFKSGDKIPFARFEKGELIASYGPDGLIEVPWKIESFAATIGGITYNSKTNKFTKEQLNRMAKLDNGTPIAIGEIVAVGEKGVKQRLTNVYFVLN